MNKRDRDRERFNYYWQFLTEHQKNQFYARFAFLVWRNTGNWDKDITLWTMAYGACLVLWEEFCEQLKAA